MKNFKKLSREELRNTFGGKSCSVTFPDGHGGWITKYGTCDTQPGPSIPVGDLYPGTGSSFCNVGNGVAYNLSSNGGASRC